MFNWTNDQSDNNDLIDNSPFKQVFVKLNKFVSFDYLIFIFEGTFG